MCRESGQAAVLIMMSALLLVTGIGAGIIALSNPEINADANYRNEQVALFAAKAGLEEGRDRMVASNPNPVTLPTSLPGTASGVLYITASGVSPWSSSNTLYGVSTYDTELMGELTAAGLTTPPSGSWYTTTASNSSYSGPTSNPVPYQWVRINLKVDASATPYSVDGNSANKDALVCYDMGGQAEVVVPGAVSAATCQTTNQNYFPVYEITSFAVTPTGAQRMLQEEVVQDRLNLTLPAAFTIDGPPGSGGSSICASGDTCSSGGDYITGNEPVSGGPDATCATGSSVPAIAADSAADESTLATAVTSNKTNITGTGGTPSVAYASSLANLSTVSEIEALVSQMEGLAGANVGATCSSLNLGTAANPTVTVVTNATGSACSLNSGTTGYGILVVTGTLDYVNVNSYQGVIMMLGTAQFVQSSSKDTTFSGALFMAQDRNPSTGALLSSLGTPTFNFHHGSASATDPSIQYDQCTINQVESTAGNNYRVLSQRGLVY
jgi:hypothetical protein